MARLIAAQRLSSATKNILLIAGSLFAMCFALEFATRLLFADERAPEGALRLQYKHYQPDPELKYVPKKNVRAEIGGQGEFHMSFTTNSRGLRDKEVTLQKPAGKSRIVVIGDSFTWGTGVKDDRNYTDILEKGVRDTEVVNLGVSGYGLRQEIGYLKREGLLYDPDIVIVGFCMNDIYRAGPKRTSNSPSHSAAGRGEPAEGNFQDTASQIKKFLAANSYLYGWVRSRINTNKELVRFLVKLGIKDGLSGFESLDPNIMPSLKHYPESLHKSFEATKLELLELKRLTDQHGIKLLVAVIPYRQSVMPLSFAQSVSHSVFDLSEFDTDKPYRLVSKFAFDDGIEVVIPIDEFRAKHSEAHPLYLRGDMHFNEAGHKVFANAIAERLSEIGWVSR